MLPCLIFVSACDSNDDAGGEDDSADKNAASIKVRGVIQADYSGLTTFISVLGLSQAITIELDDGMGAVILSAFGLLVKGTYAIGEGSEAGFFVVTVDLVDLKAVDGVQSSFAHLSDDSVTITSRNADRITGRFSGSGQTVLGEAQFSVSGDFVSCPLVLGSCNAGG